MSDTEGIVPLGEGIIARVVGIAPGDSSSGFAERIEQLSDRYFSAEPSQRYLLFLLLVFSLSCLLRGFFVKRALSSNRASWLVLCFASLVLALFVECRSIAQLTYKKRRAEEKLATLAQTACEGIRAVRPYLIASHEVTWEEFIAVTGGSQRTDRLKHPAVVSAHEAARFCELLSKTSKCRIRLPTVLEWEYACRSGLGHQCCYLDHDVELFAWFEENSGGRIHPVAQLRPDSNGVYDMLGNVEEWCAAGDIEDDCCVRSKVVLSSGESSPTGIYAPYCGGSFRSSRLLLTANRILLATADGSRRPAETGFRFVVVPTKDKEDVEGVMAAQ